MSSVTEESWMFVSVLRAEDPSIGKFHSNGLHTGIELGVAQPIQQNWLIGSIPAPNPLEQWRINAVMLQYNIRGQLGMIDKIGIRDGNQPAASFENLQIGPNSDWEIRKFPLPNPWDYRFGLGVNIHVTMTENFGGPNVPPTQFLFTAIGLEFTKSTGGTGGTNPNP
jgi:hypothetical protein